MTVTRYEIWSGWEQEVREPAGDDLIVAGQLARRRQAAYTGGIGSFPMLVRPDNIDLGLADGLTQAERDRLDDAGLW